MRGMRIKYRLLAPALLAVAALLIGGFIGTKPTEGSDWESVNLTEADVTSFIIQSVHTACLLATPIDASTQPSAGTPMAIDCQDVTGEWPDTGLLVIYDYEGKNTTKLYEEVFQYDQTNTNGDCSALGPNGLCIIARAVKGSSKAAHDGCTPAEQKLTPGCASYVTWATQLSADIDEDDTSLTVDSAEGFIVDSSTTQEDSPLIGDEVITGIWSGNTLNVTQRPGDCGADTPTTAAPHSAGDIVTQADLPAITLGIITQDKVTNALVRSTVTHYGCQVTGLSDLHFASNHPFDPGDYPYGFEVPSPVTQTGSYDKAGQFTVALSESCAEFLPGLYLYVSQVVNLNDSKDPYAQHEGSITIVIDTTDPFDCSGAGGHGRVYFERLAGKEDTLDQPGVATPGDGIEDYLQYDSDKDRCPNYNELKNPPNGGGARDPWNPWDYFEPTQNGQVRVNDIMAVVGGYGLNAGDPGYSTLIDRGGVVTDGNPWNQLPPNGQIRVGDILGVVGSYGHDCP